jgi:endonuclease/exonuclease/phosphatase family metal-dependent hydrolase
VNSGNASTRTEGSTEASHDRCERHPFAPIVVNRPALAPRSTLKIVAFNARGGGYLDGVAARLRRSPLRGADIILLCEADWRRRRSAGLEFAAELARALTMSFAFIPEFGIAGRPADATSFLGNAILSSRPLTDVYAVPLSTTFVRRRLRRLSGGPASLGATAVFNGKAITIGVAHLNSRGGPAGRDLQMRECLARLPANPTAVIGGDFNTTTIEIGELPAFLTVMRNLLRSPLRFRAPERWEPLFERLAEANFEVRGANEPGRPTFTFTRLIPPLMRPKLDWIALRGLEPIPGSAAVVPARESLFGKRFSDHDFITCEVRI